VHVLKVLLDPSSTTALGVEFARSTPNNSSSSGSLPTEKAYAGLETILAAGAVGSPHLLQLSGIGPPDALKAAGVDVLHPLPGVGQNLQDHLQVRMVFVRELHEFIRKAHLEIITVRLSPPFPPSLPPSLPPSPLPSITAPDGIHRQGDRDT